MRFYRKTIDQVEHGPAPLRIAADRAGAIAEDSALWLNDLDAEMNLSDIQTRIIQYVGRFCENYASDVIDTFTDLDPFIPAMRIKESNRWIIMKTLAHFTSIMSAIWIHPSKNGSVPILSNG